MPYCPACGVEVDNGILSCPLCSTGIPAINSVSSEAEIHYPHQEPKTRNLKKIRSIAWTILTVLNVTAFFIVMTVNLVLTGDLSWAGYAMSGIAAEWLLSSLLMFLIHRPALIVAGFSVIITGLTVLIDIIDGYLDWFLVLALPIIGMVAAMATLAIILGRMLDHPGLSLYGYYLIIIAMFCAGLDLLISAFTGAASMSWSLIVAASILPIATLLIVYHKFIRERIDLAKYFHL